MNFMDLREQAKVWTRRIGCFFLLFLSYFLLQSKLCHDPWFITDELDIMLGGKAIANGFSLYRDYLSQHMPFSYYLSALFEVFGATTVTLQRYCFYGFYALCWTGIFFRYKGNVDKVALGLFPIIHMTLTTQCYLGTTVLSEHLAGIGCVILFLEFLLFYEKRTLKWHNCICISFAIVLTFGTIFVSIFSIFCIGVAVLLYEINDMIKKKSNIRSWILMLLKKYYLLVIICAVPWVILFVCYGIDGNVKNFIKQAYLLNRVYYPKYLGGYGENIFLAFVQIPSYIFSWLKSLITLEGFGITPLSCLIIIFLFLMYVGENVSKRGVIFSTTILLFVSSMGSRGNFTFHSTHMVEVMSLISSIVLMDVIRKASSKRYLAYICFFILVTPFFCDTSGYAEWKVEEDKNEIATLVKQMTNPGEAIWQLNLSNDIPMLADRPSIANVAAVPWMWECEGARVLDVMSKDSPHILIYNKDFEVWGFKQMEYAAPLVQFVDANYQQYNDTMIYIRKDVFDSTIKRVQ